jgi:hypothetical protein
MMIQFPLFTLFLIVVAVIVLSSILSPRRPGGTPPPPLPPRADPGAGADGGDTRPCPACGRQHPAFATYCRNCGQRL